MSSKEPISTAKFPCCPTLKQGECCDRLNFKYKLTHTADVEVAGRSTTVPVDVTIVASYERCSGDFVVGDLAYTTTLLPGEKVHLFSTDRRSRFSFDTETELSYRHAQATEENFYMTSVAREMSELTVSESGSSSSHMWGNWGAEMDSYYASAIMAGTAGGSIDGHYDDQSTRDFARSLSVHADSSHSRAVSATRTSSAISIGEVSTRAHAEGESETHLEASSRQFSNRNRCHALTFFFWRINRKQTVRFTILSIERAVRDTAAPTDVNSRPLPAPTGVSVTPTSVLGTASDRLEAETRAQQSVDAKRQQIDEPDRRATISLIGSSRTAQQPLPREIREAAAKKIDENLVKAGLIDKVGGNVSPALVNELSWEQETCLPTPGVFVKGCLDNCDICEPGIKMEISLDLERKELENELLKKQIELLEMSQEYRCCPIGQEEPTE